MSNVEFLLTVNRDPQARQRLAQWERDLIDSQIRVEQRRLGIVTRSETAIAAARYRGSQQAIAAQNREYQRMLQQQMVAYRAFLQQQVAAHNAAQRQMAGAGGGVGGGGGAGARGGGGGLLAGVGMAGLARQFAPAAVGYAGYRATTASVGAFAEQDSMQRMLASMLGSKGGASKLFEQMRGLSLQSGLSIESLAGGANRMAGSGIPIDEIGKRITQLAAIAAGSNERFSRLALAFSQVSGNGRLMAEEMNQLTDAGFMPMQEIMKRTGKTQRELRDQMKDGNLGAEYLTAALDDATSSTGRFGRVFEDMADSTSLAINKMQTAWQQLQVSVGRGLAERGVTQAVTGGATGFLARAGAESEFVLANAFNYGNARGISAFERTQYLEGRSLAMQGLKSTDPLKTGNPHQKGGLTESQAEALRTYELSKKQVEVAARSAQIDIQSKKTREESKRVAEQEKAIALGKLSIASQEMIKSQEINKLRIESSKKELDARREILEVARKATSEAQKNLMSAQERFGSLTEQEQRGAISVLMKARRSGTSNLSLDEISKLRSIGSDESERFASAALRNRASAAFNVDTGGLSSILGRRESIDDEINRLGRVRGTPGVRKKAQDRIRDLQYERMQLSGSESVARSRIQEGMGVRDSLFAEERRAVVESRQREMRIQAGVKQQIEFVAHFENTSQQIAERVGALMQEATRQQSEEVIKLLKPLMKQSQAQRYRIEAQNPGGR